MGDNDKIPVDDAGTKQLEFSVDDENDYEQIENIFRALVSTPRLNAAEISGVGAHKDKRTEKKA